MKDSLDDLLAKLHISIEEELEKENQLKLLEEQKALGVAQEFLARWGLQELKVEYAYLNMDRHYVEVSSEDFAICNLQINLRGLTPEVDLVDSFCKLPSYTLTHKTDLEIKTFFKRLLTLIRYERAKIKEKEEEALNTAFRGFLQEETPQEEPKSNFKYLKDNISKRFGTFMLGCLGLSGILYMVQPYIV